MSAWQRKALCWFVVGLCLFLAFTTGLVGVMLVGAFLLLSIGFAAGWAARGDDDMAQWIYGLQSPPDDEPPERVRV